MRSLVSVLGCVLALTASAGAQEHYTRAEQNQQNDLVITTSQGKRIVLTKSKASNTETFDQVAFEDVAISKDATAVGWVSYIGNCCTSYPIPHVVEVYRQGRRSTFEPSLRPWHWCFVDGSASLAVFSSPLHGPQYAASELWSLISGEQLDRWDDSPDAVPARAAPRWVESLSKSQTLSLRKPAPANAHQCSSR